MYFPICTYSSLDDDVCTDTKWWLYPFAQPSAYQFASLLQSQLLNWGLKSNRTHCDWEEHPHVVFQLLYARPFMMWQACNSLLYSLEIKKRTTLDVAIQQFWDNSCYLLYPFLSSAHVGTTERYRNTRHSTSYTGEETKTPASSHAGKIQNDHRRYWHLLSVEWMDCWAGSLSMWLDDVTVALHTGWLSNNRESRSGDFLETAPRYYHLDGMSWKINAAKATYTSNMT